jgi:hypothetical protein
VYKELVVFKFMLLNLLYLFIPKESLGTYNYCFVSLTVSSNDSSKDMSAPKKPRVEEADVSKVCISAFSQNCAECNGDDGGREWSILFMPKKQRGTTFTDKILIVPTEDVKAVSAEPAPKNAKWSKVSYQNRVVGFCDVCDPV